VVTTDEISREARETVRLGGDLPKAVGTARKSLPSTPEEESHKVQNR